MLKKIKRLVAVMVLPCLCLSARVEGREGNKSKNGRFQDNQHEKRSEGFLL